MKALELVHLPALKTLLLDYFNMLETRYIVEVLHGCPILEDLQVNYLSFDYNSCCRVSKHAQVGEGKH